MYSKFVVVVAFSLFLANNVYSIDPVSKESAENAAPLKPTTNEEQTSPTSAAVPAALEEHEAGNPSPTASQEVKPASELEPVADVAEAETAGNEASAKQEAVNKSTANQSASAQTSAEKKASDGQAATNPEQEHAKSQEEKTEAPLQVDVQLGENSVASKETEKTFEKTVQGSADDKQETHPDSSKLDSQEKKGEGSVVDVAQLKSAEKKISEEAKSSDKVAVVEPEETKKSVETKPEDKPAVNEDSSKNIEPVKTAESIEQELNGHTKEGPTVPEPVVTTKSIEEKKVEEPKEEEAGEKVASDEKKVAEEKANEATEMSKEKTDEEKKKEEEDKKKQQANTTFWLIRYLPFFGAFSQHKDTPKEEPKVVEENKEIAGKEKEEEEKPAPSQGFSFSRIFRFGGEKPEEKKSVEEPKKVEEEKKEEEKTIEIVNTSQQQDSNWSTSTEMEKSMEMENELQPRHNFFSRMVISTGNFFGSITRSITNIY